MTNMKIKMAFFSLAAFLFLTCTQHRELVPTRTRQMQPDKVSSYHPPVQMTIAWVPYQEQKLVKTKKDEWTIVRNEASDKQGNVPVLLITYPNSTDTVWIDMNTDNAMLGKLIKHSLMTQQPIQRPFASFFETASCQKCHPSDVKVDFEK